MCAVFFLSGAATLLFETLWFYQAGLVLGNTVWASSLVLASFMGGLAIGNALIGHYSHRIRRPTRLYSLLELIIGLAGAALVFLLPTLIPLLTPLLRLVQDVPWALNVIRFSTAFVLLLVPSTAMGATLPLLVAALSRLDENFGRVLGRLYGWNTLGAVAGALIGEAAWIRWFGISGTALAAAGLNGAAALIAWKLARRLDDTPASVLRTNELPLSPELFSLLAAAFLCGGILLALEVVWFRLLTLFVTESALAFAVMLSVVLAGIGLGGLAGARWLSRHPAAVRGLPALAGFSGVACIATYLSLDVLTRSSQGFTVVRMDEVFEGAAILMGAVSLLSGVLFTLLGEALHREVADAGGTTGLLTFANTLGAAAGSLLAAFVLLPGLGMEASIRLLASGYGLVALVLWAGGLRPAARSSSMALGLSAAALAAVLVAFPSGFLYRQYLMTRLRYWSATEGAVPIRIREGLTDTIVYLRRDRFGEPSTYRLLTNSYSMSTTNQGPRRYMALFVYLPAAIHPSLRHALLISYGIGNTAQAMTRTPGLETLDVVDPSRDILESNRLLYARAADCPLNDPRVRVHLEDGRHFLQTATRSFDLITGEPPPPKHARIVSLYTREYFALMRQRLAEGGIATYWLPAYGLTEPDAKAVVRAFCGVFPDCSLWTGSGMDWILMGTRDGLRPVPQEQFTRLWRDPVAGPDLVALGVEVPEQLGAAFMADAEDLAAMTGGAPPLTDDRPKRISSEQLAWQQSRKVFAPWMNVAKTRERFERSAFIARVWPEPLRQDSLAYFPIQGAVNRSLVSGFKGVSEALPALHRVLTQSSLYTLALWLSGSGDDEQRSASLASAKQLHSPDLELHLGARALAQRDYDRAEAHFRAAEAGGLTFRGLVYHRLYALCMAGKLQEAAALAAQSGVRQGQAPDDGAVWRFLSETFALP